MIREDGVATAFRVAAAMMLLCLTASAAPLPADSEAPPPLDAQLLEDVPADSLDPAVRQGLFSPREEQPGGSGSVHRPAAEDPFVRLRRELGMAGQGDRENPLVDVARRMLLVQQLIGRIDSGATTQEIGEGIVASLDELIRQAQKQCGPRKPSADRRQQADSQQPRPDSEKKSKPSPKDPHTKPSSDSRAQPGTSSGQHPDMGEMDALVKSIWGELPETARQQMLEPLVEQFLPKYELLIEQYYQQLSKQQGAAP